MTTPVAPQSKPATDTAAPALPAPPSARPSSASSLAGWVARWLWLAAGVGLLVGFFLPWFSVGQSASMTGLGLLATSGDLVDLVTGPHRLLLFAVPMLGVALVVSAATGHRIAAWIALLSGVVILGGGLYTLIRLFLNSTGLGMWLVVGSALVALVVSLLVLGAAKK